MRSYSTLLEYLASYQSNWSEGKVIIQELTFTSILSIVVFFLMSVIPLIHSNSIQTLSFLNWGFLGITGSLTAVLLSLFNSDRIEVGNTEGSQERQRALLGSVLGFIAGVVMHSIISAGFISNTFIPNLASYLPKDVGLSMVYALSSGFVFEKVFEKLRSPFQ